MYSLMYYWMYQVTRSFMYSFMHSFMYSLMYSFMYSLMYSFMYSLMYSFMIHSCIRSYTHWCIHWCIYPCSHWCIHSCTYSCINWCIHSCIHSCIHCSQSWQNKCFPRQVWHFCLEFIWHIRAWSFCIGFCGGLWGLHDFLRIPVQKIRRMSRIIGLKLISKIIEWSFYIGFCEGFCKWPTTGFQQKVLKRKWRFSRNCVALLLKIHLTYPRMIILYWFLRRIMGIVRFPENFCAENSQDVSCNSLKIDF